MDNLRSWVRERSPEKLSVGLFSEIESRELDLIGTDGHLYVGVQEILTGLRSVGYQIALYTNGPTEYVRRVVESDALIQFLDVSRTPD